MTVCNMTIEGGGRAGMIAPDDTTFEYVDGRPRRRRRLDAAGEWRELHTDEGATFDQEVDVDAARSRRMVTWGTNPGQVVAVTDAGARAALGRRRPSAR